MENNEIIKALECCSRDPNCEKCPLKDIDCFINKPSIALDLINRQQAEIVSLKNKVELLEMEKEMSKKDRDKATAYAMDIIKKQDVEIKRLTERNFELAEKGEKVVIAYKTAKSEAIKEFAERLKEKTNRVYYVESIALLNVHEVIDNLVKEMVGEE
jgi:adenine-specific DNA glycosylase